MTGCLKSEAQALVYKDESRKYFEEVSIDNWSKIVILYLTTIQLTKKLWLLLCSKLLHQNFLKWM